jgi:hypothetical protein
MDELTENLQKLNMIKAKFDQKDGGSNTAIYNQPGSATKKAPGMRHKERKFSAVLQKINFIYLFYFHARQLFHQNLAR